MYFWLYKEGEEVPKRFKLHDGHLYVPSVLAAFNLRTLEIWEADDFVWVDVGPDNFSLASYEVNTHDTALAVRGQGELAAYLYNAQTRI
jgi:hypothetical protein